MTSKKIVKRVLEFGGPPCIGYNFNYPNPSDMAFGGLANKNVYDMKGC